MTEQTTNTAANYDKETNLEVEIEDIENNIEIGKELSCTVASIKNPNAKALAGLRNQAVSGHQNVAGQSAEVLHGLVNSTGESIALASTDMPPNASAFSDEGSAAMSLRGSFITTPAADADVAGDDSAEEQDDGHREGDKLKRNTSKTLADDDEPPATKKAGQGV